MDLGLSDHSQQRKDRILVEYPGREGGREEGGREGGSE